jgi:hypothetical protein
MPQRYAAKWIAGQANQQNQARVNAAWDDANNTGQRNEATIY